MDVVGSITDRADYVLAISTTHHHPSAIALDHEHVYLGRPATINYLH
jgi:hypothetical protein